MIRKYVLPMLAVALTIFALAHALYNQRSSPDRPPPVSPPLTPFGETVAGLGMVESSTEASGTGNIAIGSQLSGVVRKVSVSIGQRVKAGELLFELDTRQATAELTFRKAALAVAEEQLRRLKLQPRPEELPASLALVDYAEANVKQQEDLFARAQKLVGTGAFSQEEFVIREQTLRTARAQLAVAKANQQLLKAGAWEPDQAIAAATVEQAKAQIKQAETTLDLLQVRAPVEGSILQINVRPGEFVSTLGGQTLLLMGNLQPLHVRVNIDEEDLPRLQLHAPARAKIRGDVDQTELALTFVRLEPYIVPKASLTGVNTERVDTRVVQVIYAADPDSRLIRDQKVLVGQLVDVFIEAKRTPQPAAVTLQRN
jgi:multidrug resistance efflux pump